ADYLERFSRVHGRFRYCSCMRWRATSGDFGQLGKDGRIAALDNLARGGGPVEILAYCGDDAVGWCSIAPRDTYAALEHSWVLPRVDKRPVSGIPHEEVAETQIRGHG
ncbi:MAG: hypothetical protein ACRDX8_11215, partial [Acidimicrobiales bacterium]